MPGVDGGYNLTEIFMICLLLQVEDLSRMFSLFSRINGGLTPVSKIFQEVFPNSLCIYVCIALLNRFHFLSTSLLLYSMSMK